MPRKPREIGADEFYHVVLTGSNGKAVFRKHQDFRRYEDLLIKMKDKHKPSLSHHVLTPTSVELAIKFNQPSSAGFLHDLQGTYAKYFCRKYELVGHVWKAHPKVELIKNDASMLATGTNMEMLPVIGNLTKSPEAWPFSSFMAYAYGAESKIVEHDPAYLALSDNPETRQTLYRQLAKKSLPPVVTPKEPVSYTKRTDQPS